MKTKKTLLAAAFSAGLFSATGAHAALELTLYYDGDYRGVYDTDLNITWLRNANLAASNTFGVSGISFYNYGWGIYSSIGGYMNWNTAQSWIAAMNTANYLGYNDWRLPSTLQPDVSCSHQGGGDYWGYNCAGSEMSHLFYNELGGQAYSSILSTHNANLSMFSIQPGYYWSGTEYASYNSIAWDFDTSYGFQGSTFKTDLMFAWAVRPGGAPVVTSPVPEPETYAMLLAGLGLLSFTAKRRKQSA